MTNLMSVTPKSCWPWLRTPGHRKLLKEFVLPAFLPAGVKASL
jgi:hypothetical protein